MSREEKLHILIAETSPVLSAGFSQCMRRIPGFQANVIEVKTIEDLNDFISSNKPDIILVNPTFGGSFNPETFRNEHEGVNSKIIAIEIGKLSKQAAELYDSVISVIDDLDTIKRKIKDVFTPSVDPSDEKENLSQREKEIISLIVKGLTNQEIADRLFLSIHTIITHRRNITRKLEIHSATGLTIYAIVNKIVDIGDIKL